MDEEKFKTSGLCGGGAITRALCSTVVTEDDLAHLIKSNLLGLFVFIAEHLGADAILHCLGQVSLNHVAVHEVVEAGDLINEGEVIERHLLAVDLLLRFEVHEHLRALLLHVHNEVFQLFFVYFKVFHDHIVCQPITLVPELPIVQVMVEGLLILSVQMDTVPIA